MSRAGLEDEIFDALRRAVRRWNDEKAEDFTQMRRAASDIADEVIRYLRTHHKLTL